MGKYRAENIIEVNGVCLHYAEEGSGRPIILVHGNGESHDLFDVLIGQLVGAGYHVYAPDSRGAWSQQASERVPLCRYGRGHVSVYTGIGS